MSLNRTEEELLSECSQMVLISNQVEILTPQIIDKLDDILENSQITEQLYSVLN
jgi:hypothetical protein